MSQTITAARARKVQRAVESALVAGHAPPDPAPRLPPIIGFCGLAGAGKSTAALHLVDIFPRVRRERFAGPLKDMMRAFGLSAAEVDGDLKEVPLDVLCGRTPRQALQWLGTEWGRRMIGPDIWVSAWARRVDAALAEGFRVVTDDVRFLDEAQAIWARGGVVVRIARAGAGTSTGAGHASEALGFPWDVEIINAGDLSAFSAAVESWAASGAMSGAARAEQQRNAPRDF